MGAQINYCNVGINSLGVAIGAERMAVFGAVSADFRKFAGIALATDAREPVAPCKACRLVLAYFGPSLPSPLHPQCERAQLFCLFVKCFASLFQAQT
jgi:cytidine deaminase